jgi:hypothetical protein
MTKLEKLIEGLQIIHEYQSDAELSGSHEVLLVGEYSESDWSDEDIEKLDSLGFFHDEDNDCWTVFV